MIEVPYLVIPDEEALSYNEILRLHWKKRNVEANRCKQVVGLYLPHDVPMFTEVVDIALVAYYADRRRDSCNLPIKLYVDGLLKRVIKNDSPRYVRSVLGFSKRASVPRLEIYIKKAEEAIIWRL